MKHAKQRYVQTKIPIPFEFEEKEDFERTVEERCVIKGQLIRRLLLAWMHPETGPVIEAVIRGQTLPDLQAGQAKELADVMAGRK